MNSYELNDNECYSSTTRQREEVVTSAQGAGQQQNTPKMVPSKKCFRWTVVLATIINFLLIIAVGAALFHFQTQTTNEINPGFTGRSNASGIQGICCAHWYLTTARYKVEGIVSTQLVQLEGKDRNVYPTNEMYAYSIIVWSSAHKDIMADKNASTVPYTWT